MATLEGSIDTKFSKMATPSAWEESGTLINPDDNRGHLANDEPGGEEVRL